MSTSDAKQFPVQGGAGWVDIGVATPKALGLMSGADKAKLDLGGRTLVWQLGVSWDSFKNVVLANTPCTVIFDPNGATGLVQFDITAGAWDLSEIIFDATNVTANIGIQLNFVAGATLSVPELRLRNIFFLVDHPLYSGPLDASIDADGGLVERLVTCAGPIMNSGGRIGISGRGCTYFNDDAAFYMFTGGGQSLISLIGLGSVTGLGFNGTVPAVPIQVNIDADAAIDVATAIGPSAVPTVVLLADAANIHYAPTAGLFVAPDPTNAQDALNRIAALVKTLNGGAAIP